jgi:hypothetical protein
MEGRDEGPVFVTQELVPEHARALLREELHHCDPKLPGTSTICVAQLDLESPFVLLHLRASMQRCWSNWVGTAQASAGTSTARSSSTCLACGASSTCGSRAKPYGTTCSP